MTEGLQIQTPFQENPSYTDLHSLESSDESFERIIKMIQVSEPSLPEENLLPLYDCPRSSKKEPFQAHKKTPVIDQGNSIDTENINPNTLKVIQTHPTPLNSSWNF